MATAQQIAEQEPVVPGDDLSNAIGNGNVVKHVDVRLSNEVVHLLSEQLYTSPLKAVEELVVNAYDADATECRIAVLIQGVALDAPETEPEGNEGAGEAESPHASGLEATAGVPTIQAVSAVSEIVSPPKGLIAVFDDGTGMDLDGLRDLWRVGDSPKKPLQDTLTTRDRKVVGKFGIGKLATYAIATRITYVSAAAGKVHHVICDFSRFAEDANTDGKPVVLDVREVVDLAKLLVRPDFAAVLAKLGLDAAKLLDGTKPNWTLCLLDRLKTKAQDIKVGRLRYVLRTAMPLKSDFKVYLNGDEQVSSKIDSEVVVRFKTGELAPNRISAINDKLKTAFKVDGDKLVEPKLFPSGINGEAIVTRKSLEGGKSDLIGRSFGFFVKVRDRLINLDDALFHNTPISHGTFARFRADLEIDDLHNDLTAPREGVGVGERRDVAAAVAREIGLQARDRFEAWQKKDGEQHYTPEATRVFVAEHLVERPLADAIVRQGDRPAGGDVDGGWFYMQDVDPADVPKVVDQLYEERTRYKFDRSSLGREKRLARFDPASSRFTINADHQLVLAFDDPQSAELVDILATAEVMLEVYMAECGIDPFTIGEVLSRRDTLLRSLASDRVYSRSAIAGMLRDAADDAVGLELALVAAARSLGFQVKHIGGKGEPDGLALYLDSAMNETRITLEAKSAQGVPSLGQLDFASLGRHKQKSDAGGCLLLAASYPAEKNENGSAADNARLVGVSCWTIDQLANVVEKAESLEITTAQVAQIIKDYHAPTEVETAVNKLLAANPNQQALYRAVMGVLRDMFARRLQPGDTRKIPGITSVLAMRDGYHDIREDDVRRALSELANSSKGGMRITRDDTLAILTDLEEIARRVQGLTGDLGTPRSLGTFKAEEGAPESAND